LLGQGERVHQEPQGTSAISAASPQECTHKIDEGFRYLLSIVYSWCLMIMRIYFEGYGKGYSMVPSEVPEMVYMPEGLEKVSFFD
jgi:hypothetical protein